METITLNNGIKMPVLGYGVYMVDPSVTERCVLDAISVGYRSLDTAQYYENEAMVASAVRKSGIPRDEFFITSKLCLSRPTYEQAKENVKGSLRRMKMDYLDLMLIHWPMGNDSGIWRAFEDLVKEGYLRSIGVSNFYPKTYADLVKNASVIPAVNQIETHVFYQQRPMIQLMAEQGTAVGVLGAAGRRHERNIFQSGADGSGRCARKDRRAGRSPFSDSAGNHRHSQVRPQGADDPEHGRL